MAKRKFKDIDHNMIVTEEELRVEFEELQKDQPDFYGDITFEQYINNCLTRNNGTLEEIKPMDKINRLMECVFDATTAVYGDHGLIHEDWFEECGMDSRWVCEEIQKIAECYESHFPEDDDEYFANIKSLTTAWFKLECNLTLTDWEETLLFDDQRKAFEIRKRFEEGWSGYDYDRWTLLESIVGEPVMAEEYSKIEESFDLSYVATEDKDGIKKALANLRKPEKEYVIRIVQHRIVNFSVVVTAHSKEEAEEIFRRNNDEDEYEDEWLDAATCFADIEDETMSVEELEG